MYKTSTTWVGKWHCISHEDLNWSRYSNGYTTILVTGIISALALDPGEKQDYMVSKPSNIYLQVYLEGGFNKKDPALQHAEVLSLTYLDLSSVSVGGGVSKDVSFPKDSLASPKKSFTLSTTVLSSSCFGSWQIICIWDVQDQETDTIDTYLLYSART